ncbi:hypothetical protein JAAARDRAFT_313091 [Jaapia argillacea MUCL 33604]|uniref:Uncharacterized protein n=1 Tax=Jaapia argillacea MUCL 33604 TaxID=933084 RepID=A0A067PP01_9AGAM|nr:hypothetical protein JAAARDRAFT_313091 [Jaapia argillacea MUCL 33604]
MYPLALAPIFGRVKELDDSMYSQSTSPSPPPSLSDKDEGSVSATDMVIPSLLYPRSLQAPQSRIHRRFERSRSSGAIAF